MCIALKFAEARYQVFGWLCAGAILLISGFVMTAHTRMAIARQAAPEPQAMLVLGGGLDREDFAADFACEHPEIEIWISSGTRSEPEINQLFAERCQSAAAVYVDQRASDTVTNFTTMVETLEQKQIQHLYVVTSDFHMPRAEVIGTLVLGLRGIAFTPLQVPSQRANESPLKIVRDSGRSLVWMLTGYTGASLKI